MPARHVKACVGISVWAKLAGYSRHRGEAGDMSSRGNPQARAQLLSQGPAVAGLQLTSAIFTSQGSCGSSRVLDGSRGVLSPGCEGVCLCLP